MKGNKSSLSTYRRTESEKAYEKERERERGAGTSKRRESMMCHKI